jgi:hypothetical protein
MLCIFHCANSDLLAEECLRHASRSTRFTGAVKRDGSAISHLTSTAHVTSHRAWSFRKRATSRSISAVLFINLHPHIETSHTTAPSRLPTSSMADPPDKAALKADATGEKQLIANKDEDRYVLLRRCRRVLRTEADV